MRLPGGTHALRLHRAFLAYSTTEMDLANAYAAALDELAVVPRPFAPTAAADLLTRVVAVRCAVDRPNRVATAEAVLRSVLEHSTRTYEGTRVSVNVALALGHSATAVPLDDFLSAPWAAVLGSGLNTAIRVSGLGDVTQTVDLAQPEDTATRAPERFLALAEWTLGHPGRVGFAATRTGEVYVLVGGRVRFVYRGGRWRGLPVDEVMSAGWSGGTIPSATKEAVLLAILDSTAAHHGACIGIIRPQSVSQSLNTLVAAHDRWTSVNNPRAQVFRRNNFLDLSRRQRVEMLSMDGATLLDRNGVILAAGAILAVPGGSPMGGGRAAAAAAIAPYGVGIKVSHDGPIVAVAGANAAIQFAMG